MKHLYITDLLTQRVGVEVSLPGWLRTRRRSGSILFLDIVDSTGTIQVVVERQKLSPDMYQIAFRVPLESAVEVQGNLVLNSNDKREIAAKGIYIIGMSTLQISPLPRSEIDIFDSHLTDQLIRHRHLYLRNPKVMAILRFRSKLMSSIRRWFEEKHYTEFDAPILTPVPLYDDGTAMPIEVHGERVFLTQCVGFYLEAAAHAFERVYSMGPSFRGEESRSRRHLMEYYHIKAEIAFADLEDIIHTVEELIAYTSKTCLDIAADDLEIIGTKMCVDGLTIPFARISYEDVITYLQKKNFNINYGKGLGSAEERELSLLFPGPFWVVGIPRVVEPFPYSINSSNPKISRVADLIASNGYGELLGVAEKISDISLLDERLAEKEKAGDPRYEWIREIHQLGCVPHAAFGMGVERTIRWLLNIPHVRDAIPFPRIFRRKIAP